MIRITAQRVALAVVVMIAALAFGACGGGGEKSDLARTAQAGPGFGAGSDANGLPPTGGEAEPDAAMPLAGDTAVTTENGAIESDGDVDGFTDPSKHPLSPSTTTPFRQGAVQNPNRDTLPVPLEVESSKCAKLGSILEVTVTSEPDVDVAMIIGYSDREGHESQSIGTTGSDGRLVLEVPISADAPTGTADLLVVAGAPDGRRNHHESELEIVPANGSCP